MNRPAPRAKPPPTPPHPFSASNLAFLIFLLVLSFCYFLPFLRGKLNKFRLKNQEGRAERVRRELILSSSAAAVLGKTTRKVIVEDKKKGRKASPAPSAKQSQAAARVITPRDPRLSVAVGGDSTGFVVTTDEEEALVAASYTPVITPATPTASHTPNVTASHTDTATASHTLTATAGLAASQLYQDETIKASSSRRSAASARTYQSQAQAQSQAQLQPQSLSQAQSQSQLQSQAQHQAEPQSQHQALPQAQAQAPLKSQSQALAQALPLVQSQPQPAAAAAAEKTLDYRQEQEPEPELELDPKKRAFAEAMRIGGRKTSVCSVQNVEPSGSGNVQPQKTAEDAVRKAPIGFLDSRQPSCTPAPLQFGHEPSKASSSSTLAVPMNRRGSTSSNGSNNSGSMDSSTSGRLANRRESTSSQSSRKTSSSRQDAPPRYDSLANTGGGPTDACRSPSDGGPRSSTHPRARRSSNFRANQTFMSPTYVQHAQSPMLAQHQSTAMAQQHAVYAMALQQQYSKAVQQLQQHQMLQNGINQMSAGGIGQPQVLLDQLASQLTQAEDYVRSLSTQLMQAQQQLQMHQDQVRQQQAYAQFISPTTPQFYGVQTTPYHTPLQTPFTSSHTIPQTPQSSQGYRNHAQNETVLDAKQVADMVADAIMRPKGEPTKNQELVKDKYNEGPIRYTSSGWNTSPLSSSQELSSVSSSPSKGGSQMTSDLPENTGSDGLPQYDSGTSSLYADSSDLSLDQKTLASKLPSISAGSMLGEHNSEGTVLNSPPALQTLLSDKPLTADVSSLTQHQAFS